MFDYGNPYLQGATPQMQQRLNYLQQQYRPQQSQPIQQYAGGYLRGRMVTGMDEAKAAQIEMDGTSTFFPCPEEGKIYEKFLGLDGLPVFRVYQIMQPQEQQKPVYAERSYVDNLIKRVDNLEKALGGVNHESDADVSDVTK